MSNELLKKIGYNRRKFKQLKTSGLSTEQETLLADILCSYDEMAGAIKLACLCKPCGTKKKDGEFNSDFDDSFKTKN